MYWFIEVQPGVLGVKRGFVIFGVVFALLGVAQAADLPDVSPDYAPAPAVAYDWTGFYLGLQGGYEWHQDDVEDPIPQFRGTVDLDGVLLGVHAGYDYQFNGGFVVGLVGDIEWADGSGTGVVGGGIALARAEANWQGSLRARLGYAINNILLYGTGGLAFANYDLDYTCCALAFNIGDQFDETLFGYTLGGGAAYAFAPNWTVWSDYRFTDYETADSGIVNCCAGPPNRQEHDIQTHAVRLGLSRRF